LDIQLASEAADYRLGVVLSNVMTDGSKKHFPYFEGHAFLD